MAKQFIDRPPRVQPILPEETIHITKPPDTQLNRTRQTIQIFAPMVTIVGYVLVALLVPNRNPLMLIPMALAVVVSSGIGLYTLFMDLREEKERVVRYQKRLAEWRREIEKLQEQERAFYYYNYPNLATVYQIAACHELSRHGTRLWERQPQDLDFCDIRIGRGKRVSSIQCELETRDEADSDLLRDAQKLVNDSQWVDDIPITISLRPVVQENTGAEDGLNEQKPLHIAATHALSITGTGETHSTTITDFARAMLIQLTAFHSPSDVNLFVIGAPKERVIERWQWARSIPHCNSPRELEGDYLCFEEPDPTYTPEARNVLLEKITPEVFWNNIKKELTSRDLRSRDSNSVDATNVTLPHLVIVVDKVNADSFFHEIETHPVVAFIIQHGKRLGASLIFVTETPQKIPNGCDGIIEVEEIGNQVHARYLQTGVNSPRCVVEADLASYRDAESHFVRFIREFQVPMSGFGLRKTLNFLEMMKVSKIAELEVEKAWAESMHPEKADWLKVPIGEMSGGETRYLTFSADMDGVHGLIAGTTGSGKSELLLTLICGLAVRYDPRVLNMVLVDYKGGAAFSPFRNLPHVVDIVTNLQGRAVERMFDAIKAELDRRSKILDDFNIKHIVEYRIKAYHLDAANPLFPHLLIIVDEFAEMIQANSDFKNKFESIARLGRALGVSLILATQRPTGYVTDQMRANMKFRICLRVENAEDSREILGRSEAAFLPWNIPGRAYVQIGNDVPLMVQVARAGGPYAESDILNQDDIRWLDDPITETPNAEKEVGSAFTPETLVDWLVVFTSRTAQELDIPVQRQPWPEPLPKPIPDEGDRHVIPLALNLDVDTTYIKPKLNETRLLNPYVAEWMNTLDALSATWKAVHWETETAPFQADIGLIDHPLQAEQRILSISLPEGPIALLGASGWGKTTFLRTLMISLAAMYSPKLLHLYALDFASQGLSILKSLPHLPSIIEATDANVEELVNRLIRMLQYESETRQALIAKGGGNLVEYNKRHPESVLPAILVVVDNFAEIKENDSTYDEEFFTSLSRLIRNGRPLGIYFAVTATLLSDLGKVATLFTQRLTLTQTDPSEYTNIVGRGVPLFDEVPGRGLIAIDRQPLVFQIGIPFDQTKNEKERRSVAELYEITSQKMYSAWAQQSTPPPVEILPDKVNLHVLIEKQAQCSIGQGLPRQMAEFGIICGLKDVDRKPAVLDIQKLGPHFIVIGPPGSGKTTTLHTLALSLAHLYTPEQVGLVLIDPRRTFGELGQRYKLRQLPHVLANVTTPEELRKVTTKLRLEYDDEYAFSLQQATPGSMRVLPPPLNRHLVVLIDNYALLTDFAPQEVDETLSKLVGRYATSGLHFFAAGPSTILRQDFLIRQLGEASYGIGLQTAKSVEDLGGRVPYGTARGAMPNGRGYIVKAGRSDLVQVALPVEVGQENALDTWIGSIIEQYSQPARWRYSDEQVEKRPTIIQSASAPSVSRMYRSKYTGKPVVAPAGTNDSSSDSDNKT